MSIFESTHCVVEKGRLWQTLVLSQWNPLFSQIPVESMVYARQQEYYAAIAESTEAAESTPFVEFMLQMILERIISSAEETHQVAHQVARQVGLLLSALVGEMSRSDLMQGLALKDRVNFKRIYLDPALADGLIEMTVPDKPNSRLQKYCRLTQKGRMVLENE